MSTITGSIALVDQHIPAYLKSKVIWHRTLLTWDAAKHKLTKTDQQSLNDFRASSSNSSTWSSYDEAIASCTGSNYLPAIAIKKNLKWICLDIDNVLNPDDGEIPASLKDFIKLFKAYAEISASGTGIHMLFPGSYFLEQKVITFGSLRIEVILDHFITLTGAMVSNNLTENQDADYIHNTNLINNPKLVKNSSHSAAESAAEPETSYALEDIGNMLKVIPPDIGRDEWFKILAALKDWSNKAGEAVVEIANEWSSGRLAGVPSPANYQDRQDVETTLNSIRDRKSSNKITIGTLVYKAKQYGWTPPQQSTTPPARVYIPQEVAALWPGLESYIYLEEHGKSYLTQVVASNNGGISFSKTTPTALKKSFYAGYDVYLKDTDAKGQPTLTPINIIDYWNEPHRYGHAQGPRLFKRIDFDPSPAPEPGIYNLYTGLELAPRFDEDVSEWLEFLALTICGGDPEAYRFFLDFTAQLVQQPHILPMVALVLRGEKRTGKSGMIDLIARLLGNQYSAVANHWEQVIGRFNAHLAGKLLITIDDATWGGYKEGVGFLNNLVTGQRLCIEGKGQNALNMNNYARVVIIGNGHWLVPKTRDDGRFFVIDVPPRCRDDQFYQDFFAKWQQPEQLSKLLGYLLKVDLSGWRPIDIIRNRIDGSDMGLNELSPLEEFVFYCASKEVLEYPDPRLNETTTLEDIKQFQHRMWPPEIRINDFRDSYKRWCDDYRQLDSADPTRFSRALFKLLEVGQKNRRNSNSIHYWAPMRCAELRAFLIKKYKLSPDHFD